MWSRCLRSIDKAGGSLRLCRGAERMYPPRQKTEIKSETKEETLQLTAWIYYCEQL